MKRDPQQVYYPLGGKKFLLHWWSYYERGNIILSDSEQSLDVVARKVFHEHPDAEIKGFYEIEIVAPTERMQEFRKTNDLDKTISMFHSEMVFRLKDLVKAGHGLPSGFEICPGFKPEEGVESSNWDEEYHFNCLNCTDTIKLVDMTKKDLYDKYYEDWEKVFPHKGWIDPKLVNNRANLAKNESNLFEAVANFGHHSSGIDLVEIDFENIESYLNDRILFFFHRIREIDSSELQKVLTESNLAMKKENEEREENRIKEYEREDKEKIDAVIAFFAKAH